MKTPRRDHEYYRVHVACRIAFGIASAHECIRCGGRALDWAFQYPEGVEIKFAVEPNSYPYTDNVSHYAPMCRPCHTSLDSSKRWEDPEYRAMFSQQRREDWEDPEFRARCEFTSERLEEFWQDPAYRAAVAASFTPDRREINRGHMTQLWANPGSRERMLARFTCDSCGLDSTASGVTNHQRFNGHSGKTRVVPG